MRLPFPVAATYSFTKPTGIPVSQSLRHRNDGWGKMRKVVIFGGGVAGLSAAHELVERNYQVEVYEAQNWWGGKARSFGKPGSGTGGRKDLPAEHGFRFFPGFYKHLPDTMKRIPFGKGATVFDNLVPAQQFEIAREGRPPVEMRTRFPRSLDEWREALYALFRGDPEIPSSEVMFFVNRLLTILTTCQERRLAEYEKIGWWDFIDAEDKSAAYQKLLAEGNTRNAVAMKARVASARTIGDIGIQFLFTLLMPDRDTDRVLTGSGPRRRGIANLLVPGRYTDRVLDRPTNEAWIDPWITYLKQRRVELYNRACLKQLNYAGGQITSAVVDLNDKEVMVTGDYYLCAIPVERMINVLTDEIKRAAPSLAQLDQLHTEWMSGIQFYLNQDVPILKGHVSYADSKWALSSISQHQFWPQVNLSGYGDGRVQGILSVDISDWETQGDKVVNKPARYCTKGEIKDEVWAQMQAHLNTPGSILLDHQDQILIDWSLDPDILQPFTSTEIRINAEPLLVNTVDTWRYRPEVETEIPNLFLAADYVRTHTDLATMEAANEAARRAVNAILKASATARSLSLMQGVDVTLSVSRMQPCGVWPLEEPAVFAPARAYDYMRFKLGLGHYSPIPRWKRAWPWSK
jgi:15-cis-phytoene desaturase